MEKDTADAMRGMVRRATVKKVNDDGEMQTVSVEVADGIVREDIEVAQAFGQVSHSPEDGGLVLLFAVGGDQGDLIAMPVGNPSTRMGKVPKGTAGLSNASGDRVLLFPNGTIDVKGGGSVNVEAGAAVNITAASSVKVTVGGVTFLVSGGGVDIQGGKVTHNGTNIGDDHAHSGVLPGASTTGPPT